MRFSWILRSWDPKLSLSRKVFHEVRGEFDTSLYRYWSPISSLLLPSGPSHSIHGGVWQVYTQGLHRREFEVSYTHRREKALKEGEDASIELARQMEAQVCCLWSAYMVLAPPCAPRWTHAWLSRAILATNDRAP